MDAVFGPDGDPTVASHMWVLLSSDSPPFWHVYSNIVKDWTSIGRLHLIHVPTLLINGRKDIAQDFVVEPYFEEIPKVKWITLENSTHTPFFEERERYFQLIADFLEYSQ
jgi:pimeloyl-ACP methyl ester carboxylesterase